LDPEEVELEDVIADYRSEVLLLWAVNYEAEAEMSVFLTKGDASKESRSRPTTLARENGGKLT